jgi:hypothetical protein
MDTRTELLTIRSEAVALFDHAALRLDVLSNIAAPPELQAEVEALRSHLSCIRSVVNAYVGAGLQMVEDEERDE